MQSIIPLLDRLSRLVDDLEAARDRVQYWLDKTGEFNDNKLIDLDNEIDSAFYDVIFNSNAKTVNTKEIEKTYQTYIRFADANEAALPENIVAYREAIRVTRGFAERMP